MSGPDDFLIYEYIIVGLMKEKIEIPNKKDQETIQFSKATTVSFIK